ncbi:hypothetical protein L7F22_050027 [Adiantum nelumboides]|nr:hypothetical protein [Adiantum nelumboides]
MEKPPPHPRTSPIPPPLRSPSPLLGWNLAFSLFIAATASPSASPSPMPVNITQIMEGAGQFGTFLSLLSATNVGQLFQTQANKTTTGITVFAPTDKAFSSLEPGVISKLTAQEKIILLEFHALSAFYPLSALQQATDPVTPTIATDSAGVGKYTVNVTNQEGTVVISTGLTNAALISTLYNTVPCGVFAINQVLLPEEIFGLLAPAPAPAPAPSPASAYPLSPASSPGGPAIASIASSPASPFGPGLPSSTSPPLPPPTLSSSSSVTSPSPSPFALPSFIPVSLVLLNSFLI